MNEIDLSSRSLVIYLFSILVLLAFFRIVVRGDKDDTYKKIIGGLGVFLVALVANNAYVYFISFFIGGLLIATENFLIHLAGIFKADKHHVSDITKDYYSKISDAETEDKIQKEAVDALDQIQSPLSVSTPKQAREIKRKIDNTVENIKKLDERVFRVLATYLNRSFQPYILQEHVRVKGEDYVKNFDAVVAHVGSEQIYAGIEIKYFEKYNLSKVKNYFANETTAYNAYKVIFVLVFTSIDQKKISELKELRNKIIENNYNLGIVLCSFKDDSLMLIDDSDFEKFFPPMRRERYDGLLREYLMHKRRDRK